MYVYPRMSFFDFFDEVLDAFCMGCIAQAVPIDQSRLQTDREATANQMTSGRGELDAWKMVCSVVRREVTKDASSPEAATSHWRRSIFPAGGLGCTIQ